MIVFFNPLVAAVQVGVLLQVGAEEMRSISGKRDFYFAIATKRSSWLALVEKLEKSALVKLALLAFGWPLALNHFYEGNAGLRRKSPHPIG